MQSRLQIGPWGLAMTWNGFINCLFHPCFVRRTTRAMKHPRAKSRERGDKPDERCSRLELQSGSIQARIRTRLLNCRRHDRTTTSTNCDAISHRFVLMMHGVKFPVKPRSRQVWVRDHVVPKHLHVVPKHLLGSRLTRNSLHGSIDLMQMQNHSALLHTAEPAPSRSCC